eukprot:2776470-Rhodomonas_salina.1
MLQGGNRAYSSTLGASGQRPSSASRVLDRPTVNKVPLCSGCEMVGPPWKGGNAYFRSGFRDVEVNKEEKREVRTADLIKPLFHKIEKLAKELKECREECNGNGNGTLRMGGLHPRPPSIAPMHGSPKRKQTRQWGG